MEQQRIELFKAIDAIQEAKKGVQEALNLDVNLLTANSDMIRAIFMSIGNTQGAGSRMPEPDFDLS